MSSEIEMNQQEINCLLRERERERERNVNATLKCPITENQQRFGVFRKAALVSFVGMFAFLFRKPL